MSLIAKELRRRSIQGFFQELRLIFLYCNSYNIVFELKQNTAKVNWLFSAPFDNFPNANQFFYAAIKQIKLRGQASFCVQKQENGKNDTEKAKKRKVNKKENEVLKNKKHSMRLIQTLVAQLKLEIWR